MSLLRYEWELVPWREIDKSVFKLQKRIYRASSEGDVKKTHRLQRLLLKSNSAKLLAVRKVTQDNRGRNTPGVDGVAKVSPKERIKLANSLEIGLKAQPTRRVWIPKPGKEEKRPLGIPTMFDRALQALLKMALEPEWEAKFEPNSFGFRPGRSCHDAIEAIFGAVNRKPKYVLDADISGCFDNISHSALLQKLKTTPKMRKQIKAWLKSGVVNDNCFQASVSGTPQGGVISPLLANIALHGMENEVKEKLIEHVPMKCGDGRKARLNTIKIIRYADDFVIIHPELSVIKAAKTIVSEWLSKIGLELKDSKTRICHTVEKLGKEKPGFDFLGFNIRGYKVGAHNSSRTTNGKLLGFKVLTKPSKKSVRTHYNLLRGLVQSMAGVPQVGLITKLNPIIRGWSNYFCTAVSRDEFNKLSHWTHLLLWEWGHKRHAHKGDMWIRRKYFRQHGGFSWRFMTHEGEFLMRHNEHKIKRHTKVRGDKSPYDGDLGYWGTRLSKHPLLTPRKTKLLKKQKGKCAICENPFGHDDILEIHHVDPKDRRKSDTILVHGHCHDNAHRTGMNVNHQKVEEPYESKGSRTVLKASDSGDTVAEFN